MDRLSPTLRVLGVPALHGPDGEPITFRTRKHFALLIYLALEPQTHRREKLGALLWPGATTAESRHSLATGLSVLRARLGRERLETDRDTVRLVPGSVELDLDRLARGEVHATETSPALPVAPLLQEFVVADAGPWDQWRDALGAKWLPVIRDALLARIERARRQGNTRAMESLADALLQLDDLSEDGVRAKMEARAFAGDRLTALQQYEAWRVRLAEELGAQPSELVAGMALRLRRRGWERTSGEHIPAVRTDQWKDRYFVGRAKEYEALYGGWEGCQRGALRHVLLTGESGVGKSTLVERLTTAAGLQGAVVARIQCHEVEREIPYGAIGGLIALLLDRPGATAVAPEWLSELSRTVSAVRRKFPNVAPPQEATGEMVRIRLADAFHELVRAIAEEQPLILVMDDIHLSDDASVAVMHLLLRRLTDERLLVICTLRQGDGSLAPSARGMLERAEVAQMSVIPLPPLLESESAELLAHLVPGEIEPPPSTVRRALLRAGGGLPMLLELLVVDWLAHGNRCVALAVEAMTEEPGAAGGAGVTYRRLLDRLTGGLDAITRSVLHLAAILGSQLNDFELYSLVDLTLAQAMSGLSQLAQLRICRDSGHGLEFVNEVMRGEAYLAVPSSVRKVLHSKVADRLIERQAAGEEMLGLAIAWHCMRSGRGDEGGLWLVKGAGSEIARGGSYEVEAALRTGLPALQGVTRACAQLHLAMVLSDEYRYTEALAVLAAIPDDQRSAMGQDFDCELAIATSGTPGAAIHDSAGHLNKLFALLASPLPSVARLRIAQHCVGWVLRLGDEHLLTQLLTVLEDSVAPSLSSLLRDRYDLTVARLQVNLRRTADAFARLDALGRRRAQNKSTSRLDAERLLGLGCCFVSSGEYARAIDALNVAGQQAQHLDLDAVDANVRATLAVAHFRLGNYQDVITETRAVLLHPPSHSATAWYLNCLAYASYAAAQLSHTELALQCVRDGDHVLERFPHSPLVNGWSLLTADTFALLGRISDGIRRAATGLAGHTSTQRFGGRRARWSSWTYGVDAPVTLHHISTILTGQAQVDLVDRFEASLIALHAASIPASVLVRARLEQESGASVLPEVTQSLLVRLCSPRSNATPSSNH